jgi:hypothetical protein
MLAKTAAVLLVLSMWSGSALAFGAGGAGGGAGFGAGVPNPYKYYPVCPRGRAGDSCQCRVAGASEANMLCRTGEICDTHTGTCGPGPARR